jgi:hypothetical protein
MHVSFHTVSIIAVEFQPNLECTANFLRNSHRQMSMTKPIHKLLQYSNLNESHVKA